MTNRLSSALEIVERSDPGLVRGQNEDSVLTDARHGLAILADGMGGYNAGEVASRMATTLLASGLKAAFATTAAHHIDSSTGQPFGVRCLVEQIEDVNSAIYRASGKEDRFGGMGTTLVASVFCDDQVIVAHVGDSRLYRLRGDDFVALTRDHSLLQEQLDSGLITAEEARHSTNRNLVTRAVGVDAEVDVEIHLHQVRPGDLYLLCSDGLYDMVDEADIRQALLTLGDNLVALANHLVQMANDNGGEDNVSVVLVRVLREFPAAGGGWSRFWSWHV
ncbi:MAG: Protein phosphatase PrpC [Accumulibacter sp.]|uniref:Stp1/IreP family PP2C-type Ser/Thr phosphatase n=1 Tax=Accumulibacter sp. TaxID=2053492 RepID=UPI00121BD839|nr:Stp1/IreP family PP2C-type Ser/Thr phosphatase [Accumulibacter sp.]TLD46341.1 MAG: Protein phosphatase PrpC [Accumulibacter sp.]